MQGSFVLPCSASDRGCHILRGCVSRNSNERFAAMIAECYVLRGYMRFNSLTRC